MGDRGGTQGASSLPRKPVKNEAAGLGIEIAGKSVSTNYMTSQTFMLKKHSTAIGATP